MAESGRERKRRKWDVAAPQGVPVAGGQALVAGAGNRPGIGSVPGGSYPAVGGLVTPQGVQMHIQQQAAAQPQVAAPPTQVVSSGAPSADVIARAKQGAMSVLEKINQDLRAKGGMPMRPGPRGADDEPIKREVTINDAPGPIRYNLTRRATQDDIARRTGTTVVVRGRYVPPGAPPTEGEPPLFLKITPGLVSSEAESVQQQAVDRAASEVQHILSGGKLGTYLSHVPDYQPGMGQAARPMGVAPQHYAPPGQPGFRGSAPGNPYAAVPPPAQASLQGPPSPAVPLYIGIDAPPEFTLAARLRGPDDAYLKHIAGETGTQVVLKGRGSGMVETPEPVHIFVSGGDQKGNSEAVRLAKNLIDTVREEFQRMYPYGPPPAQPTGLPGGYGTPPPTAAGYPPTSAAVYSQGYGGGGYPPPAAAEAYLPPGAAAAGGYAPSGAFPVPGMQQHQQPAYYPPAQGSQAQGMYPHPTASGYPPPSSAGYMPQQQQQHQHSQQHAYQGYNQQEDGMPQQQQQQYASPIPAGSHAPQTPISPPSDPHGNGVSEDAQKERRRRFKEFKDSQPPVPAQPAPYAPRAMGPPPPRLPQAAAASMGPPPPRGPQAGVAQGGSGNASHSNVSGSLAGLVDYD